jgi:hypothetical protein
MNSDPRSHWRVLSLTQIGLLVVVLFLIACLMLLIGIGGYLWLEEPDRLALGYVSTNQLAIIDPQPAQVSPKDRGIVITNPTKAFFLGANGALWVNGKPFKSSTAAAWELVRSAWRLWLLIAVAGICIIVLGRRAGASRAPAKKPEINSS